MNITQVKDAILAELSEELPREDIEVIFDAEAGEAHIILHSERIFIDELGEVCGRVLPLGSYYSFQIKSRQGPNY